MKKMLSALALVLVVAGCSNASNKEPEQQVNEPAAITTLDAATFASEFENAEKIKVFIGKEENPAETLVEVYLEDEAVVKEVKEMVASLSLTKSANSDRVYGNPFMFIDLNTPLDSNYVRFSLSEDMIVIQTSTDFVNYDVDDASEEAIEGVIHHLIELYGVEAVAFK